jgi:hypothetical protein
MFDLLKEYLRAKINCPIITKHTAFFSVGQVCMKMGLHYTSNICMICVFQTSNITLRHIMRWCVVQS